MDRWTVQEPTQIELDAVRRVEVRIVSGHVEVVGGDGPPRLEVSSIEGPPLHVRLADGVLEVSYEDLSWRGLMEWLRQERRRAVVSIAVPRECEVELGVVTASALAAGVHGRIAVKSVSGEVVLDGVGSRVTAHTVSGNVESRGLRGELDFKTVSGDLTVVDARSGAVRAKTVSGDLTVDLHAVGEGGIELDSVSGDITLRLPGDADLAVDVRSTSGKLGSAFDGLAQDRQPGQRRLEGTLGEGAGRLRARTVSGDVALLRRVGGDEPA